MVGQYGISSQQKQWLNGQTMPIGFSEAKARSRVLAKAREAWDIFVPILRSKVVNQEFKDSCFVNPDGSHYDFDEFCKLLVQTYRTESFDEIKNKIHFADQMLTYGLTFFEVRFNEHRSISDEIAKFREVINDLEDMVRIESEQKEATELYRQRGRLSAPPQLDPERRFWQAECIQCHKYNLGIAKNEKQSIELIEHDKNCRYLKEISRTKNRKIKESERKQRIDAINFQYIRTIRPKKS